MQNREMVKLGRLIVGDLLNFKSNEEKERVLYQFEVEMARKLSDNVDEIPPIVKEEIELHLIGIRGKIEDFSDLMKKHFKYFYPDKEIQITQYPLPETTLFLIDVIEDDRSVVKWEINYEIDGDDFEINNIF
jgi:hypothetical protein